MRRINAKSFQGSLLDQARAVLEETDFVAMPFSSNDAAALTRGHTAIALLEHTYPLNVLIQSDDRTFDEIWAAFSAIGEFEVGG